jgi:hypothetical protein
MSMEGLTWPGMQIAEEWERLGEVVELVLRLKGGFERSSEARPEFCSPQLTL